MKIEKFELTFNHTGDSLVGCLKINGRDIPDSDMLSYIFQESFDTIKEEISDPFSEREESMKLINKMTSDEAKTDIDLAIGAMTTGVAMGILNEELGDVRLSQSDRYETPIGKRSVFFEAVYEKLLKEKKYTRQSPLLPAVVTLMMIGITISAITRKAIEK